MNTHSLQRGISVLVAMLGAAIFFAPPQWQHYIEGSIAVLLAGNHELGKGTEIKGDTAAVLGVAPVPPAASVEVAVRS